MTATRLHPTSRPARRRALAALTGLLLVTPACSTTTKVVVTPLTVVRDVVDAPVTSLANVFEFWADRSDPTPTPGVGVGVGPGGVTPGIGINLGYYVWKPLSWIFGGVDYLVCRSLYPCFPTGISPWKEREDSIGSLYFPNTRYLWRDAGEDSAWCGEDGAEVEEADGDGGDPPPAR